MPVLPSETTHLCFDLASIWTFGHHLGAQWPFVLHIMFLVDLLQYGIGAAYSHQKISSEWDSSQASSRVVRNWDINLPPIDTFVWLHPTDLAHRSFRIDVDSELWPKVDCYLFWQVNAVEPGAVVVHQGNDPEPKKVSYGTCIWTTGNKMHPLAHSIAESLPEGTHHCVIPAYSRSHETCLVMMP